MTEGKSEARESPPETVQAGIAGDLFVVTFVLRTWYLNEVLRISGPFADFVRRETRAASP